MRNDRLFRGAVAAALLLGALAGPAHGTVSRSQMTNIPTEGWDGPGLGSAVIEHYAR